MSASRSLREEQWEQRMLELAQKILPAYTLRNVYGKPSDELFIINAAKILDEALAPIREQLQGLAADMREDAKMMSDPRPFYSYATRLKALVGAVGEKE
jgi:hypothetical protein